MSDVDPTLEAIATARETLESIDEDDIDEDTFGRGNAKEQLDNVLLDATAQELVAVASDQVFPRPTETSEDVVKQRHAEAGTTDTVSITIELTSPMVEFIDLVRKDDEGETVTDWIKRTVETRLARREHEFWSSVTVPVEVELPPEAAQWARLWTDHRTATGSDPCDVETRLMDYIDLEFDWRVEGGGEMDVAADLPGAGGKETVDLCEVTGDAEDAEDSEENGGEDGA
jgi:hypothetical protein